MHRETPTIETYTEFDRAYRYFNAELFQGNLTPCVITLQRQRKAYGYFSGGSWVDADGQSVTDEIALNPNVFQGRPVAETLSTLVHEMCHLQQHHFGKPGRGRYHNKAWVKLMDAVGLVASDTGKPGGKQTGERVSHYIREDGAFDRVCQALLASSFIIPWLAKGPELHDGDDDTKAGALRKMKLASKTKYTCAACGLNAWAKPDARLVCGQCNCMLTAATEA